jgi:3-dehydroquinate synthase
VTLRGLEYPIVIEPDIRERLLAFLRARKQRCVIVSDANSHVLRFARSIARSANDAGVIAVPLGERRKRIVTVAKIWEQLARCGAGRDTLVAGVGGGVAADLFGFTAATYVRGVPYVHVATTLVAMADAAIGGKTGVDLRAGKNLAGAFSNPVAVYAHVDSLGSLPLRQLREGLAEVVKAAIIDGREFFNLLERLLSQGFTAWPWPRIVVRAASVKIGIVRQDPREEGEREKLNLGHTFAHGIERASDYLITHGAAVAIGLRAAALLSTKLGMLSYEDYLRTVRLLTALKMPVRTSIDPDRILEAMAYDKKRRAGKLRFVLPRSIGRVEYGIEVPERRVLEVLKEVAARGRF